MRKYDWQSNPFATAGELYRPAMLISDENKAAEYLRALVTWAVEHHGQDPKKALNIQKQNLGYFAGYYDSETMERVNRLFKTAHPIFGNRAPEPRGAFELGKNHATKKQA